MKFLSLPVVEISLTKNLERKKTEQTKGRTNSRRPIFNPTIQLVVVDLSTKYKVSILNGCGDIFDKKCYGITDGRTDGTTDRCKPVYPPLFQSGGIKTLKTIIILTWTEGQTEPRTDVNQYTPHFFKAGGIKTLKNIIILTCYQVLDSQPQHKLYAGAYCPVSCVGYLGLAVD